MTFRPPHFLNDGYAPERLARAGIFNLLGHATQPQHNRPLLLYSHRITLLT